MSECSEEQFLKDVSKHEMIVLRDDGLYRHIRFKRPGTGCMHFDLVTWPGYLAYSGDMGCYVFSRLEDMFEFFRTDREHMHRNDGKTLAINLGYWSEKLQAVDGNRHQSGAMEFDEDRFRQVVSEIRLNWIRERCRYMSKEDRRELWEAVASDVLDRADDGEHAAGSAAYEFSYTIGGETFTFDDFFEHNLRRFTFHFIWCCYALAWGIAKYDATRAASQ